MAGWSKEVFAKNLRHYMEKSGKNQKELAEIVGVSAPTMNDWLKAKKYPRIDKIEILARYFGILKSDLIENKSEEREELQKKAGAIAGATLRMKNDTTFAGAVIRMDNDPEFLSLVDTLNTLDNDQIQGVTQMLAAFLK